MTVVRARLQKGRCPTESACCWIGAFYTQTRNLQALLCGSKCRVENWLVATEEARLRRLRPARARALTPNGTATGAAMEFGFTKNLAWLRARADFPNRCCAGCYRVPFASCSR